MANSTDIIANTSFAMLRGKIGDPILYSIKFLGFTKPTEIQAKTLPHLLMGKDLIGAAKTGSGKTLAFLIPILEMLNNLRMQPKHGTCSIILSPTRELALQTYNILKIMLDFIPLTAALIVGGKSKEKECEMLTQGINIVVATPGRLLDHLQSTRNFRVSNLKIFVMDEADKLLEAGFLKDIKLIVKKLPKKRQTVLFSATITDDIESLANLAMSGERVYISAISKEDSSTNKGLTQGYCICPLENRMLWLFHLLKKTRKLKVMVFFSSCKSVDFHAEFFRTHCKADVISIHGKRSQSKRKEAFELFMSAKRGVLFCTDVAARGLDIPSVDWIIQYDPPSNPKEYIHRVGRTARGLSATGNAVLLLRPEEQDFLEYLQRKNIHLDKFTINEDKNDDSVQNMLESLVSSNGLFRVTARKALTAFLRAYATHAMSDIFTIASLDLKAVGKAFGFAKPPPIDMSTFRKKSGS